MPNLVLETVVEVPQQLHTTERSIRKLLNTTTLPSTGTRRLRRNVGSILAKLADL